MATLASTAKILIATDIISDAALVKGILNKEFDHVFTSTDPDKAVTDFVLHRPDVLVLAFNELEKSERYYLSLHRFCQEIHQHPHHTVILCNKDEVKRAYELCMKDIFDDYILFWPMTYESPRLNMSIHYALRELTKSAGPSAAEFASQARRLAELEQMPGQQMALEDQHIESASRTTEQAECIRPTVLVVDDDEFQHKLIGKLLEAKDYQLIFASSGIEALNIMRKTQPDIVLMDVMMPDMDGIETTRHLKAVPQLARIPVVMITGKSEGQVVIDSLKAGATDFVVKPFDRATLIAKVGRALGMTTS